MKRFEWNEEKNKLLRNERQISFEEIVEALKKVKIGLIDDPEKE